MDDEQKTAVDHVARPSPPWREGIRLTECGLPVQGHPVISREALFDRLRTQGLRRAAMSLCMTCMDTARRHPAWEEDPVACLGRDVYRNHRDGGRFKGELLALAALVSRHRDEFAKILEDQIVIVRIEDAAKHSKPSGAKS